MNNTAAFPRILALSCLLVCVPTLSGQFEPDSAQVLMSFPQLVDGGPKASGQWQTSFLFVNPSLNSAVAVRLLTYTESGGPLSLDLGDGSTAIRNFTIPPQGSRLLRSVGAGSTTVIGWAIAESTIPIQATVTFTLVTNGTPVLQASAPGTVPTLKYWSPANRSLGVALVNINSFQITVNVTAFDSAGNSVGVAAVTLAPSAHTSFNLSDRISGLSNSFTGSIRIDPQQTGTEFVAWTLNVDSGLISTLPTGNLRWPISHYSRIWLVFQKVLDAAPQLASAIGTDLFSPPVPQLFISTDPVINAFASANGTAQGIQINLALSELISDSPSELAFAVGHELGHIVQFRTQRLLFNTNPEFDADEYGMFFSLAAGFDPYAAAGALAKLSMATNQAGLVAQLFDNISGDLHGSFNNRLAVVYSTITALCQFP
jgi:Peptidase family M48